MANAKKCDRCGAFYEHYEGIKHNEKVTKTQLKMWTVIDRIEHDANSISVPKAYPTTTYCNECAIRSHEEPSVACCHILDLCPNCMQEFVNFLTIEKLDGLSKEEPDDNNT